MSTKDKLIDIALKILVVLSTVVLIAVAFKASQSSTGALIPLLVIFGACFLVYYTTKDS